MLEPCYCHSAQLPHAVIAALQAAVAGLAEADAADL